MAENKTRFMVDKKGDIYDLESKIDKEMAFFAGKKMLALRKDIKIIVDEKGTARVTGSGKDKLKVVDI